MRRFVLFGAALMLLAGCHGRPADAPAPQVVRDSMDALGGLDRWSEAEDVEAEAVVTTYDGDGTAHVSRQRVRMDLPGGRLSASAVEPRGSWDASVALDGEADFDADGFTASETMRNRLTDALATLLHRVRGPVNLLEGDDHPAGTAQRVKVGGRKLVRVPVAESGHAVKAYYFDSVTRVPVLVTAGADRAGREGTVTRYEYRMLEDGTLFPHRIEVLRIGPNVLVGEEPVLKVEFVAVQS
jgi:hypothetical protein